MFFVLPAVAILAIYILAAVLPAAFLLRYIYKHDQIEKEPPHLLLHLFLLGIAAALFSIVLERLGSGVLLSLMDPGSPAFTIVFAFVVVSAVEEGTKLFFLWRRSWRETNFNYRFDGIVYSVFVSLGFAAYENISYVMHYGLGVALPRALLAVPGHMGFAVFMGLFYGRAKVCMERKDEAGKRKNLFWAYFSAVFLHGFYDACAMIGTGAAATVFLLFVVVMYAVVIRLVKKEAAGDGPVA